MYSPRASSTNPNSFGLWAEEVWTDRLLLWVQANKHGIKTFLIIIHCGRDAAGEAKFRVNRTHTDKSQAEAQQVLSTKRIHNLAKVLLARLIASDGRPNMSKSAFPLVVEMFIQYLLFLHRFP